MLIIFNPAAGGRRRRRLNQALAVLSDAGRRVELAETRGSGDAVCIAAEAARRGHELVVAAGGDGTIAEVAGGIAGSGCALGLLPLGTANVLALELGVPLAPAHAAAVLLRGRVARLHPGVARFGDGTTRLFVQMLGAGFDASVVEHLDLGLKRRIGRLAYVWQSLRELPRYDFAPIAVRIDGVATEATSVIVSKGRLYAGRHRIAPDARPGEPGFQVVLFRRAGAGAAALAGLALPLGLVPQMPGVTILAAQRIALSSMRHVPVQADGDAAGAMPVELYDAPAPLQVLLP